MSPKTVQNDRYQKVKLGPLLGVNKRSHTYLCQDK